MNKILKDKTTQHTAWRAVSLLCLICSMMKNSYSLLFLCQKSLPTMSRGCSMLVGWWIPGQGLKWLNQTRILSLPLFKQKTGSTWHRRQPKERGLHNMHISHHHLLPSIILRLHIINSQREPRVALAKYKLKAHLKKGQEARAMLLQYNSLSLGKMHLWAKDKTQMEILVINKWAQSCPSLSPKSMQNKCPVSELCLQVREHLLHQLLGKRKSMRNRR